MTPRRYDAVQISQRAGIIERFELRHDRLEQIGGAGCLIDKILQPVAPILPMYIFGSVQQEIAEVLHVIHRWQPGKRQEAAAFIMGAAFIPHPRLQGFTHEGRSEEHTSELQSLMRISYAVF